MLRIDTHQHFWTFRPEHYSWIDESMTALRRDYGPADLAPELAAQHVDGTVAVEARGHLEETDNLLAIAARTPFVRGVVGWLPLTEPGAPALIERYAQNPQLRGVRHWLGADDEAEYMDSRALHRGIEALLPFRLSFDLLSRPPHLGRAAAFVDRHPEQVFIVDHCAKPYIREGKLEPWRSHMLEVARRPNVYCKVSGLVTEADVRRWRPAELLPYLDTVLEAFTPERLMFGSDWPVCTLGVSYARWLDVVSTWSAALSESERARLFGGTALEVYRL